MVDLRQLFDRAARQHGLVGPHDIAAMDLSRQQVHRLCTGAILERVGPGTFAVGGHPATWHQRVLAACFTTGGVASHRTAAILHHLLGPAPERDIDVIVARSSPRHAVAGARLHSTTWLPGDDVLPVEGIPCTSVARTSLLLAAPVAGLDDRSFAELVDRAVERGLASDPWLWWHLERTRRRGRPGVARLERTLVGRDPTRATESWLERRFLELLEAHGLPLPRCQARIERDGAFVARVDFLYDGARLVIEVNGHAHHSSRSQLAHDAARRNELHLAGYRVLEFTYDQIVRDPEHVAGAVRAALHHR